MCVFFPTIPIVTVHTDTRNSLFMIHCKKRLEVCIHSRPWCFRHIGVKLWVAFTCDEGTRARPDQRGCGASSGPVGSRFCWTRNYSRSLKGRGPVEEEWSVNNRKRPSEHEHQTCSSWNQVCSSELKNLLRTGLSAGPWKKKFNKSSSVICREAGIHQQ